MSTPWRKGPLWGPSDGHKSKLSPAQRGEIADRLDEGESPQALALEYSVTAGRIRQLRR